MGVNFLDTYALVEISVGNPNFIPLLDQDFVILDLILAEFYNVLLRKQKEEIANFWCRKLDAYVTVASLPILIKAIRYRYENRKQNISFFDAVGYIYARENNMKFVTGDKEFKNKEGVEFIK